MAWKQELGRNFEYQVEVHPAGEFLDLVYFCNGTGACKPEQVPGDQTRKLEELLNMQGRQGWELAQAVFGKSGVVIIWKREIRQLTRRPRVATVRG